MPLFNSFEFLNMIIMHLTKCSLLFLSLNILLWFLSPRCQRPTQDHGFHNLEQGLLLNIILKKYYLRGCQKVKTKYSFTLCISQHTTHLQPPKDLNPEPSGHEFHNFGIGLNAHYNNTYRRSFSMQFTSCVPFTHKCLLPNLVEFGLVVSEKKLKMFEC